MTYLAPSTYTHLCEQCRQTLADITSLFQSQEMPDDADPETPCNHMYDHRMFCGGSACVNKPLPSDCPYVINQIAVNVGKNGRVQWHVSDAFIIRDHETAVAFAERLYRQSLFAQPTEVVRKLDGGSKTVWVAMTHPLKEHLAYLQQNGGSRG